MFKINNEVYIYYYPYSEKKMASHVFKNLLLQLPPFIQHQVLKYKNWQDQQRCLIGKSLLKHALDYMVSENLSLDNLKFTHFNRPYLNNGPDFNISHAYSFTICAISHTNKVGIDIEKIKEIDVEIFKNVFSETEMQQIVQAENKSNTFYALWTKKEALIKAVGTGLNWPLDKISIENSKTVLNGNEWFLHKIDLHQNYLCCLCTNTFAPTIVFKEVQF